MSLKAGLWTQREGRSSRASDGQKDKTTVQRVFLIPFILSLLHLFIEFTEHLLCARHCSES